MLNEEIDYTKNSYFHAEENLPDITKDEWLNSNERFKSLFKDSLEKNKQTFKDNSDVTVESLVTQVFFKELDVFTDDKILNAAKGYMTGPVCFFRSKPVCAIISKAFDTLEDMRKDILLASEIKDMILYMTFKRDGKFYWRGNFADKI